MTAAGTVQRRERHLGTAQHGRRVDIPAIAKDSTAANDGVDGLALVVAHLFSAAAAPYSRPRRTSRSPKMAAGRVGDDPEGAFLLAATLVGGHHMAQAAPLLRCLSELTSQWTDHELWRQRVEFLWAAHAERTADNAGVLDHCRAANQVPAPSDFSTTSPHPAHAFDGGLFAVDAVIRDQLPLLAIRAHIRLGQSQLAQTLLESHFGSQDRAEASQPATVALLAGQQGRLNDARRLACSALQTAEASWGTAALFELDARLVLADVFFERNELDAAQDELETTLWRCRPTGAVPYLWMAEADLIRVMIAREEAPGALPRLHSLRRAIGAELTTGPLLHKLNQAEVDVLLGLGDLEEALQLARSIPDSELPTETVARLDLLAGRSDRALTRLDSAGRAGLASEIRRLVVRACADRQQGRGQRALDTMRRAVEVARPDYYIRPFLEMPSLTVPLLRGLSDTRTDPYILELVGQAEKLVSPASGCSSAAMVEPLTERERQILQHLTSHHNLSQIGAIMGVSTNTIKTHVKAIYRKTGATSRDNAVSIARSHGLVFRPSSRLESKHAG